jgi:hypothetical protein
LGFWGSGVLGLDFFLSCKIIKRVRELIDSVRSRYTNDDFFLDFDETCQYPLKYDFYQAYNDVLMVLDNKSWNILKIKALKYYLSDSKEGRKRQGFFNILNEAFPYRYLANKGYKNIRSLEENEGKKTPDITFSFNNEYRFCECKTINFSDNEIKKRERNFVVYGTEFIYGKLNDGFFNKLYDDIKNAKKQLNTFYIIGLTYIIIKFDDYTLDFHGPHII